MFENVVVNDSTQVKPAKNEPDATDFMWIAVPGKMIVKIVAVITILVLTGVGIWLLLRR